MARPGPKPKAKIASEMLEQESFKTEDEVLEREDRHAFEEKKTQGNDDIEVEIYNIEEPGAPIKVCVGPAHKLFKKTFLHGGKYKIPRDIVKIIESRKTPMYKWMPDGTGSMQKQLMGYTQRFSCKQVF